MIYSLLSFNYEMGKDIQVEVNHRPDDHVSFFLFSQICRQRPSVLKKMSTRIPNKFQKVRIWLVVNRTLNMQGEKQSPWAFGCL